MISVWGMITQSGFHNYWPPILDAIISVGGISAVAWIISNILRFYRPSQGKEWMLAGWILFFSYLCIIIAHWLLLYAFESDTEYNEFMRSTFWLRYFIANLILTCVSLITWIARQSEVEAKSKDRYNETQKLAKEAELNSIRQQLQPHFLFNSLNSIYALIGTEPAKARMMVQNLSDFLRGTLQRDTTQLVEVQDEMLHTRLYLEIEKVRFPRLIIEWKVDTKCENMRMPVLLLQPIVENAIKFGLYDMVDSVQIDIEVSCIENELNISIQNPFDPTTASTVKGTGFGLNSIRRRLFLLYGRNDLLQITIHENKFLVLIKIPEKG